MLLRKPNLFQLGEFKLHTGIRSQYKIECDSLTKKDWETLAKLVSVNYSFGRVFGVPKGGLPFEKALEKYKKGDHLYTHQNILIVDDVFTTGVSMEGTKKLVMEQFPNKKEKNIIGVVVFARNLPPTWIKPIFQMW